MKRVSISAKFIVLFLCFILISVIAVQVEFTSTLFGEATKNGETSVQAEQQAETPLAEPYDTAKYTRWQDRLNAPTTVSKINGTWFMVDCWHNRVIYSDDFSKPIADWNIMDNNLAGPHSIAYGEGYYAVEDTGNHQVIFYKKVKGVFVRQTTVKTGRRPHRIAHDKKTKSFLVLSSYDAVLQRIAVEDNTPKLVHSYPVEALRNRYSRSFTLTKEGTILFVVDNLGIAEVTIDETNVTSTKIHSVPAEFTSLHDIFQTDSGYIITGMPNVLGYIKNLSELETMSNQAQAYGFDGAPYYVSEIEGRLYIPSIYEDNSVAIFSDKNGKLKRLSTVHDFNKAIASSMSEKTRLPK